MVHFVGAGCGAPDLITVRGAELLKRAEVVIYAGSLVNPALLGLCPEGCLVYNSAEMTLEEVFAVINEYKTSEIVRLHTGDTSLYSAAKEQIDLLDAAGIPWDITPGVSSFSGAAATLGAEYTLPGISQTVIITRMAGRTPVLSAGMLEKLQGELLRGAYTEETPAAIVYKATWPEERVLRCPLGKLAETGKNAGIRKTALIVVGDFLGDTYERSKLYDPAFSTEFREASR